MNAALDPNVYICLFAPVFTILHFSLTLIIIYYFLNTFNSILSYSPHCNLNTATLDYSVQDLCLFIQEETFALTEVSLFLSCQSFCFVEVFLNQIEGLGIEGVEFCTDFKTV